MSSTYENYKKIIEDHLTDFIYHDEKNQSVLHEAMKYSLTAGGKRIRPVLLLAACDAAGGDIGEAIPFACAIECIHTYSLIHDDLPAMDNDDLRRGKPTNHKVYGEAMAILAGDGLLTLAFEIMSNDIQNTLGENELLSGKIHAQTTIAKASGHIGMIEGQVMDISAEGKKISGKELELIHSQKTGALIAAAVEAGLYIGGASKEVIKDFRNFAMQFGLAFQIQDDILDEIGSTEELGKPAGSDKDLDKSTYVAIYGLDGAKQKFEESIRNAISAIAKYPKAKFFQELAEDLKHRMN